MAEMVRKHPMATAVEKQEATYVCAAVAVEREDRPAAIQFCVEYSEQADVNTDKRLKSMMTEAMQQLDAIRQKSNGTIPDAVLPLSQRAVVVLGEKLKDPKWQYALGNV